MTTRQQWIAIAVVAVLMLGGVLVAVQAFAPASPYATIGERAPGFAAPVVPEGTPATLGPVRTLADYDGQVVLLNFWATWCEPCKVEMPSMEALHRDFAQHGLRVVAVSEDAPSVTAAELRKYAVDLDLTFEILHDTSKAMTSAYQIVGYPTTFVIARDGTVRRRWIGPEDWNSPSNRALVRDLLGLGTPQS